MATYLGQQNAILPIHFFKIILKTNVVRLKIPNKFTRRYGNDLSNPVIIKPSDDTEWKVYWTKQNDEVWFEKGWKEFVENYSIDHGYLILFKYEGTSQFDVLIFDQSALEINYPSSDNKGNHDHSGHESVKILGETLPDKKARPKSPLFSARSPKKMRNGTHGNVETSSNFQKLYPGDQSDQGTEFQKSIKHQLKGVKTTQRTSSLNCPKYGRAKEVAKNFVSYNPFFTVFIKPSHLEKNAMKVVPKFINIDSKEQDVMLLLGKRSWPVKLVCYPNCSYDRLSSGWCLFATESKLQVGDVCIFELIDKEIPVLKVHVFKSPN